MSLENIFVRFIVKNVAIPATTNATPKNNIKLERVNDSIIFEMVTIAPFLALSKMYNAIKDITIFTVFNPPTKIKNPSLSIFLVNCDPNIAACDGPNPGIKEHKLPDINDAPTA